MLLKPAISKVEVQLWRSRSMAARANDLMVSVEHNTLPWREIASQTDAGMVEPANARMVSGCHIIVSII
jgi:hypothetical protein